MLSFLSSLCSLIGSIILAVRVYKVLNKFKQALELHEENIVKLIHHTNTRGYRDYVYIGADEIFNNFMKNSGLWLLVVGFMFLILGAFLKVIDYFLTVL